MDNILLISGCTCLLRGLAVVHHADVVPGNLDECVFLLLGADNEMALPHVAGPPVQCAYTTIILGGTHALCISVV